MKTGRVGVERRAGFVCHSHKIRRGLRWGRAHHWGEEIESVLIHLVLLLVTDLDIR